MPSVGVTVDRDLNTWLMREAHRRGIAKATFARMVLQAGMNCATRVCASLYKPVQDDPAQSLLVQDDLVSEQACPGCISVCLYEIDQSTSDTGRLADETTQMQRIVAHWAQAAGWDDPTQAKVTPARRTVLRQALAELGDVDAVNFVIDHAREFGPWRDDPIFPSLAQLFAGKSLEMSANFYRQSKQGLTETWHRDKNGDGWWVTTADGATRWTERREG